MTNRVGSKSWTENRLTSRLGLHTQSFKVHSEGCPRSGLRQPFRTMEARDRLVRITLEPEANPQNHFARSRASTKAVCDEPLGFNGRRRRPHLDGRGIPSAASLP